MSIAAEPDHAFILRLERNLRGPLPGSAAQRRFEPELSFGRHQGPGSGRPREAAVLALLYPRGSTWYLPLTLRPASLANHASQISLPGGCTEPGEGSDEAALRELHEELGVESEGIRLLGSLTPLWAFRGSFLITPWVAFIEEPLVFDPSPAEVDELIEIPVFWLLDPRSRKLCRQQGEGFGFSAPCFRWRQHSIWGATAMILAELLALVGEAGDA